MSYFSLCKQCNYISSPRYLTCGPLCHSYHASFHWKRSLVTLNTSWTLQRQSFLQTSMQDIHFFCHLYHPVRCLDNCVVIFYDCHFNITIVTVLYTKTARVKDTNSRRIGDRILNKGSLHNITSIKKNVHKIHQVEMIPS